jgi:hypothetical protein
MGKHVKIGDQLQVVFAPAKRGVQTEELINGRRAFATDSGPTPLAGDRWEVMVVGMNPDRTVYFVEPLNLVEAADGLGEVLKPFVPFYHEFIRETETRLARLLSHVGTMGADDEADALDEVLGNCLLPEAYRAAALSRFEAQRVLSAAS